MKLERIKSRWIDAFTEVFGLSSAQPGACAAIASESQSRPVDVHLAELAPPMLGARVFHLELVTPRLRAPVPVRSTGA